MVPTGYQILKAFPLTPNGKVDRRSLPSFSTMPTVTQPPRTPQEKIIAGIWAEVLDSDRINLNDNFFELGGHSLLATRVIAQIRQVFKNRCLLAIALRESYSLGLYCPASSGPASSSPASPVSLNPATGAVEYP